jgi:indole-3-glycerol phosphate synthase
MIDGILKTIVEQKTKDLARAKKQLPLVTLKVLCLDRPRCKDFYIALASRPGASIIAECKRKSPSKGVLIQDYDPLTIAKGYERGGAAAVSVLTDEAFFGGSLTHLEVVSNDITLPTLCKDFIIDEYQIYEAFRFGASSFLLLAALHDDVMLQYLTEVGRDLGMEPLLEVHSEEDLARALKTDCKIIGVNTRDLRTMQINPEHGRFILDRVTPQEKSSRLFVFESGVASRAQIEEGLASGFKAFLIGETLMKSKDPEALLRTFTGEENVRG